MWYRRSIEEIRGRGTLQWSVLPTQTMVDVAAISGRYLASTGYHKDLMGFIGTAVVRLEDLRQHITNMVGAIRRKRPVAVPLRFISKFG
jgi:hypothetical protein